MKVSFQVVQQGEAQSVGDQAAEALRQTVTRLVSVSSLICVPILGLIRVAAGEPPRQLVGYAAFAAIFLVVHRMHRSHSRRAGMLVSIALGVGAWAAPWVHSSALDLLPSAMHLAVVLIVSSFCWNVLGTWFLCVVSSVVWGTGIYFNHDLSLAAAGMLWLKISGILLIVVLALYQVQKSLYKSVNEAHEQRVRFANMMAESRSLESLGRLAGGVAHDFNNLLTVIVGTADILQSQEDLAPEIREEAQQIVAAGERAAELTGQLLAVGRRQVLRPFVLCPNKTLKALLPMVQRLLPANIEVELALSPDLGNVSIDVSRLEQVIVNLVVNAKDAMPSGGKITMETHNTTLDASYADKHPSVKPGEFVQLTITDTGEGMEPETLSRLFEPFYTTKNPSKGTGLGLATVHGIVQQSGGHVFVYSEPGQGTCFTIYLPRVLDAAFEEESTEPQEDGSGAPLKILLIEDQPNVRLAVERMLVSLGHQVVSVPDGAEALSACSKTSKGSFDVLMTDAMMPQFKGSDLTKRLLEQEPTLKVLYMTSYTENSVVGSGTLLQGVPRLSKPFTKSQLDAALVALFSEE